MQVKYNYFRFHVSCSYNILKLDSPLPKKFAFVCSNENRLIMIKSILDFILKVLFFLEIFIFYPDFLVIYKSSLKAKVNFNIYDTTDWITNSYILYPISQKAMVARQ